MPEKDIAFFFIIKVSMEYIKKNIIFSIIKLTSTITLDYSIPSEMLSAQNASNSSREWNSAWVGEMWPSSQNQFVHVIDTRDCVSAKLFHTIWALIMINRYLWYAQEMCCLITFTWKRRHKCLNPESSDVAVEASWWIIRIGSLHW